MFIFTCSSFSGAATFSTTTLSITICHYVECHYVKCHYVKCHYVKCHYAECSVLFIAILNVIILSVVMLSVVASFSSDTLVSTELIDSFLNLTLIPTLHTRNSYPFLLSPLPNSFRYPEMSSCGELES